MDDKGLQEYKQKIKGLTPTELTDILSHINRDKFPDKYAAIEAEIALRSGKAAPPPASPGPSSPPPPEVSPSPKAEPEEPAKARGPERAPEPEKAGKPESAPGAEKVPEPEKVVMKPPAISLRKSKTSFSEDKPPAPVLKSSPKAPVPSAVPEKVPSRAPRSILDGLLNLVSAALILAGIYVLSVAFMDLPGAAMVRETLTAISPHFF